VRRPLIPMPAGQAPKTLQKEAEKARKAADKAAGGARGAAGAAAGFGFGAGGDDAGEDDGVADRDKRVIEVREGTERRCVSFARGACRS